jgi:TPP-dependent pyruvate/acetoin dehydrogenase alpha subunit
MRARIQTEVAEALEQAEAAAVPAPETAFDHVYGGVRVQDYRARLRSSSGESLPAGPYP